jgi:hypothetical protein
MEVSAETLAKVPGENLRVSRAEFGAVWSAVEHWASQPGPSDPFLIGVLRTCRWLAGQPVWSRVAGRAEIPVAPVTFREHAAMPETIDAEYLAAASPRAPELAVARGVVVTLEWTWHGSRRPPLDLPHAAAG